jgi:hypothetical protein
VRTCALLLAVLGLVSGCGLDRIPYLEPPNSPGTATAGTPIFIIDVPATEKEAEFRGYELYYKFYKSLEAIESNLQGVTEDVLRANQYKAVCSASDTVSSPSLSNFHVTQPLIYVETFDRNRAFQIKVTFFAPPVQPEVLYDGNLYSVSIRRNVPDTRVGSPSNNEPKPFIQMDALYPAYPDVPDSDIQAIWGDVKPGGTGIVYLAMYVLSYGVVDITTDVFSTAVWLGYAGILTNQ